MNEIYRRKVFLKTIVQIVGNFKLNTYLFTNAITFITNSFTVTPYNTPFIYKFEQFG